MKNWPIIRKISKNKQNEEAVILKYSKQDLCLGILVMGIFPYIFT